MRSRAHLQCGKIGFDRTTFCCFYLFGGWNSVQGSCHSLLMIQFSCIVCFMSAVKSNSACILQNMLGVSINTHLIFVCIEILEVHKYIDCLI